jgi:hypothetical protein
MANDRIEIVCQVCGFRKTIVTHCLEEWGVPGDPCAFGILLDQFFLEHMHFGEGFDAHRHFIFQTEDGLPTFDECREVPHEQWQTR